MSTQFSPTNSRAPSLVIPTSTDSLLPPYPRSPYPAPPPSLLHKLKHWATSGPERQPQLSEQQFPGQVTRHHGQTFPGAVNSSSHQSFPGENLRIRDQQFPGEMSRQRGQVFPGAVRWSRDQVFPGEV
ncbi:hypothetical protein CALCODRAFT_501875 [Calocera cornea HHB12733]|uniref:Uncharacterized protein n=1 Tax=Calocera cornea HHB12733 TaxID=1353952 RepID=A0A165DHJ8_9BASI|nr:hypothetical protein CALCODRAFT_501875 [Calocera cornea HHB12733]